MAFCTQCGTLHNDEDKHVCNPKDIPQKGKIKKKGSSVFEDIK